MGKRSGKYKIIQELNLCIECFTGEWNLEETFAQKKELMENPDYIKSKKTLIVYDNLYTTDNIPEAIKDYEEFAKKHQSKIGNRIVAVLIDTPLEAVAGMLSKESLMKIHEKFAIFSTQEQALIFLGLIDHKEDITKHIEELKQN